MIRNFLFSILFFTGIIFISIIFLPSFFLPKRVVLIGGKLMGYWTGFCLKFILSVKILIKGDLTWSGAWHSWEHGASHQWVDTRKWSTTCFSRRRANRYNANWWGSRKSPRPRTRSSRSGRECKSSGLQDHGLRKIQVWGSSKGKRLPKEKHKYRSKRA